MPRAAVKLSGVMIPQGSQSNGCKPVRANAVTVVADEAEGKLSLLTDERTRQTAGEDEGKGDYNA